jgi:Low affinity iron permease
MEKANEETIKVDLKRNGKTCAKGCTLDRKLVGFCNGCRNDHCVGCAWTPLSLFGYVAARRQYRYHCDHIPNELVAALHGASNRLISVEQLTEDDLQTLQQHYEALSRMASKDLKITESHSVEEASRRHRAKTQKANRNKKEP